MLIFPLIKLIVVVIRLLLLLVVVVVHELMGLKKYPRHVGLNKACQEGLKKHTKYVDSK